MRQAGKWLTDHSLAVNLSDIVIMGRSFYGEDLNLNISRRF